VDLAATHTAFSCHVSQFPSKEIEPLLGRLHGKLRKRVYLQP
jgi:hypothetical protein